MGPPCVLLPHQLLFFFFFFFFFSFIPLSPQYFAIADGQLSACEPFTCGNITNLSYPFWFNALPQYCGRPRFKLDCKEDNATINVAYQDFRVIDVHSTTRTLTIARMDLWGTICPNGFYNTTLDNSLFSYASDNVNSTIFYDCESSENTRSNVNLSTSVEFNCSVYGSDPRRAYFSLIDESRFNWSALGCGIRITVPVRGVAARSFMEDAIDPVDVIDQGFEVKWELTDEGQCEGCRDSGGRCGYDVSLGGFTCFCPNQGNDQHGFCFRDDPGGMFSSSQLLV